jgi:hypothetical protein
MKKRFRGYEMKGRVYKNIVTYICIFLITCLSFLSACFDSGDGILSVRSKAKEYFKTQSNALIQAVCNRDTATIKGLFCPMSQQLADIDKQIEDCLAFIDGNIVSYNIKDNFKDSEGYTNHYGTVTQYYSYGEIDKIVTDTGKTYEITYHAYIVEDDSIKGMTWLNLYEAFPAGYDYSYTIDRVYNRVGRMWSSPYDIECGILSAKVINAISEKDTDFLLNNFNEKESSDPEFKQNIENYVAFFNGNPLFTERDDGLYGNDEHDFWFKVSYDLQPNDSNPEKIYTIISVYNIETDTGDIYELYYGAFFNYSDRQFESFDYMTLTNSATEEKVVANYID